VNGAQSAQEMNAPICSGSVTMGHPGRNQNTDWLHRTTVQNCGKFSQGKVVLSLCQDKGRKEIQHFLIWLFKSHVNSFSYNEYFASQPRTGRQGPGEHCWAALCQDSPRSCSEPGMEISRTTADMGPVDTDTGYTGTWLSKNLI